MYDSELFATLTYTIPSIARLYSKPIWRRRWTAIFRFLWAFRPGFLDVNLVSKLATRNVTTHGQKCGGWIIPSHLFSLSSVKAIIICSSTIIYEYKCDASYKELTLQSRDVVPVQLRVYSRLQLHVGQHLCPIPYALPPFPLVLA